MLAKKKKNMPNFEKLFIICAKILIKSKAQLLDFKL
jgi:hypothetical protein